MTQPSAETRNHQLMTVAVESVTVGSFTVEIKMARQVRALPVRFHFRMERYGMLGSQRADL
jgi:hypothetical protein